MHFIPTTATVVRKIKLAAREFQRSSSLSLSEALNRAAQDAGYDNFHHVTVCAKKRKGQPSLRFVRRIGSEAPIEGDFYIGPDIERVTAKLDDLLDELGLDFGFDSLSKAALRKIAEECRRMTAEVPLFLDGHAHRLGALYELQQPAEGLVAAQTAFDTACGLIPKDFTGRISRFGMNNRPFYRLSANLVAAYLQLGQTADMQCIEARIRQLEGEAQ